MKRGSLIGAVGLLAGGIIGAGIFSLPFVVQQSGLVLGLGLLFIATVIYSITHLMYADIIIGTPGQHRFVGYIRRYLGVPMSFIALLMAVVEMVFVMTIYLVLSISFTQLLVPQASTVVALFVFWAISSISIFINRKRFASLEVVASIGIIGVITVLFFSGIAQVPAVLATALVAQGSGSVLLPLAAILFALSGRVAIPSLIEYLRGQDGVVAATTIKKAILYGTGIPALVYALFIVAVLALSGTASSDAITGIIGHIPTWLVALTGLLGLLSLWSSYILVGLDVSETLQYDLEVPLWLRLCIVVVCPIVLYGIGFTNFIGLVSLVGGIFLAFEGLFVVMTWSAAKARGTLGGILTVSWPVLLFIWVVFCSALMSVLIS